MALICCGLNSTITATLSGQIVMEGFLNFRIAPWLRRLVTRLVAIVPAVLVTILAGEQATGRLLILSQVVLSFGIPFAVLPLVRLTSDRQLMGDDANHPATTIIGWAVGVLISLLNVVLIWLTVTG